MRWHVMLLELVSKSRWTIEERGLDEVDETWVKVDLDVRNRVLDNPWLQERSQIMY